MKNYQKDQRESIAQELDRVTFGLRAALDKIDAHIKSLDSREKFDALQFVREFGDHRDEHCRILLEKLEKANAADSARGDHPLDVHLRAPDWSGQSGWFVHIVDGHADVASLEFATFDLAKAAFDAICAFLRIAGREGEFTYETPRPAPADADPVPF